MLSVNCPRSTGLRNRSGLSGARGIAFSEKVGRKHSLDSPSSLKILVSHLIIVVIHGVLLVWHGVVHRLAIWIVLLKLRLLRVHLCSLLERSWLVA